MVQSVTIFGGSGFVGRYVAQRMAKAGWRVRVAVRRPNEAHFVRPYGNVGQVEPILCNIRDEASIARALEGADAVVNCVGILKPVGANTFLAVQQQGARSIAQLAAERGIERFVHVSAIGADVDSDSTYSRTKGEAEAAALEHHPNATILRPSVIFGPEDAFFNRFAGMARQMPFIPVVGADTRFQPVYVDDVAAAVETALLRADVAGIYELGGPEVATFQELMEGMIAIIHRNAKVLRLPFFIGGLMATAFTVAEFLTFGLFQNNMITHDQLKNLRRDNVVSNGAKTFADLGITAQSLEAILPQYLWCYRPSGQYSDIKASAKNIKL